MPTGESRASSAKVSGGTADATTVPHTAQALSGTRYEVYGEIAAGGMASVQYGRLIGPRGFSRGVAIKRLHPHLAKEPASAAMFLDEARLSARLVHANIIPTLDVIEAPGELALVMEYVHGESLLTLLRLAGSEGERLPVRVACALIASVLHGLHAAHETRDDAGKPLDIVHRDVSPPNILVGADGVSRVLDFGVAKASGRQRSTPRGEIKGKLAYIAPEQLRGGEVDRRADIYSASAVLWETLVGHALFDAPNESTLVHRVLLDVVPAPSTLRAEVPASLDSIVLRGLDRDARRRFDSARDMALLIERDVGLATQSEVSDWLQALAGHLLRERARSLIEMQENPRPSPPQLDAPTGTRRIGPVLDTQQLMAANQTPRPVTAAATRWRRSLALLALGLVVSLGIGLAWAHRQQTQARPVLAMPLAAEPPPTAAVRAAPIDAPSIPPPTAAPGIPIDEPEAPAQHASRPPKQPAAAKSHASAPNPCKPYYYYIDDLGIRRLKPECL
jgi:eukaryotic-like serine/threonine-protein kinase